MRHYVSPRCVSTCRNPTAGNYKRSRPGCSQHSALHKMLAHLHEHAARDLVELQNHRFDGDRENGRALPHKCI